MNLIPVDNRYLEFSNTVYVGDTNYDVSMKRNEKNLSGIDIKIDEAGKILRTKLDIKVGDKVTTLEGKKIYLAKTKNNEKLYLTQNKLLAKQQGAQRRAEETKHLFNEDSHLLKKIYGKALGLLFSVEAIVFGVLDSIGLTKESTEDRRYGNIPVLDDDDVADEYLDTSIISHQSDSTTMDDSSDYSSGIESSDESDEEDSSDISSGTFFNNTSKDSDSSVGS